MVSFETKKNLAGVFICAGIIAGGLNYGETILEQTSVDHTNVLMDADYKKSSCHAIQNTKQIGECISYFNRETVNLLLEINDRAAEKAAKGSKEDIMLQKVWISYACHIGPGVKSLPQLAERFAPCLDAATKISRHFKIDKGHIFEAAAEKLKEQMQDAAKQAPLPTITFA